MTLVSATVSTHVFRSLWLGPRLSPLEHLCIKSFLTHGHRFVLYAYEDVANVPAGCAVEDARPILGEQNVFLQESGPLKGTASTFSDRFRYGLLRAHGGWWVDTDVFCLKDDISDTPYVFAKGVMDLYNNAVLKAPPDSELLTQAIARSRQPPRDTGFLDIGTLLIDELVRDLGLEDHAWAPRDVYPLTWEEALTIFDPARADRIEALVASSTFIHFFTNVLRLANVLKDLGPPESSYLDRLYEAYGVEVHTERRYKWTEIEAPYLFLKDLQRSWLRRSVLRRSRSRLGTPLG